MWLMKVPDAMLAQLSSTLLRIENKKHRKVGQNQVYIAIWNRRAHGEHSVGASSADSSEFSSCDKRGKRNITYP